MTWLIGVSVECLGGCYEASLGLAVAAVLGIINVLEDCCALKVLLVFLCMASCCLERRI